MNFLKRALLSVKARKGKSLLQIFIFTVICVLVLSGLTIQSAAEKSSDLARKQLGGTVTLKVDMDKLRQQQQSNGERRRFESIPIQVETAEELAKYSEVKTYNFFASTMGIASDFEAIENSAMEDSEDSTENTDTNRMPIRGGNMMFEADVTVQGVAFTDSVQDFTEGTSTLVEGRHLTNDDLGKNVTIIEKSLAEENELSVGKTISIQSPSDEENSIELEIVGIYETTSSGSDQAMNFAALNPYNHLYVPYTTATLLKGSDYEGTLDSAIYYMNDPENIDSFINQAQTESSIDFDTFMLDANDQLYQQMVGPIQNVASFSNNVVYLVSIAGAVILGLIVMMSIRERVYEMGVLLAIGEKKWKLIGQFIAEILIVALIAMAISTISGNLVANKIGDQLLSQEMVQSETTSSNPESFGGRGGMRMGMFGQTQQQADPIDELQVNVTAQDLGFLGAIGLLIAILSTLVPSISILRLQPKTILTKQG